MKHIFSSALFFALALALCCSCAEHEPVRDIRDPALGSYVYNMKVFEMTAAGLLHLAHADLESNFEVTKGTGQHTIHATDGEFTIFAGDEIQRTRSGFTFRLADQTGAANGEEVTLKGYPGIDHEGSGYEGCFLSEEKTISVSFTFRHDRNDYLVEVTAVGL